MAFCRNCGTDIGEAKFCPNCGTGANNVATTNAVTTPNTAPTRSSYYPQLTAYASSATALLVFGILSLVCCMGIGLIFEIIAIVISNKMKDGAKLEGALTDPAEIAMFNAARSKHKIGAILASIALVVTGVLLFLLIMLLAINAQL